MGVIVANTDILEEQDKVLFQNQRAYQGNKTVTYTITSESASDYLGLTGDTTDTITLDVYVSKVPTSVFDLNATMLPIMEIGIDFFDDTNLTIGKTFVYNGITYTVYSWDKSATGRITVRGRGSAQ